MNRVKILPSQSAEFLALGYEIEIYAILPDPVSAPVRKEANRTKNTQEVVPSVDGKIPKMGAVASMWPLVHNHFWGKDLLKKVPIKDVQEWVVNEGGKKNMVSQYIHAYGCLRIVNGG